LICYGKIETTSERAKALVKVTERLLNRARREELSGRRWLYRFFQDQGVVNWIEDEVIPSLGTKTSGFFRSQKVKVRKGDNAIVVRVEFLKKYKSYEAPSPDKKEKAKGEVKDQDKKGKEKEFKK